VGVHMLRTAVLMQPSLFCLGMGGFDRPLPQMLRAMGWQLAALPFYFRVHHPSRFLRQIAPLRQNLATRFLADAAVFSGAGWLAIKLTNAVRTETPPCGVTAEQINQFTEQEDRLWQQCLGRYALVASRDCTTLNVLYSSGRKFLLLRVRSASSLLGWAVVLDTQMRANKFFGDLRLGSIVDCFSSPDNAPAVIQAATRFLEERGVDLTISNQSHRSWCSALKSAGFFEARSNFIFAASKSLTQLLSPFDENKNQIFLNRGDGDGRENL
jgi:hypothetical protein